MADVKACRYPRATHKRAGFAVIQGNEAKILVRAPKAFAEDAAQRRAAQGELPPRTRMPKAMPPGQFILVQRHACIGFPLPVGPQVNVDDGGIADIAERMPPGIVRQDSRERRHRVSMPRHVSARANDGLTSNPF